MARSGHDESLGSSTLLPSSSRPPPKDQRLLRSPRSAVPAQASGPLSSSLFSSNSSTVQTRPPLALKLPVELLSHIFLFGYDNGIDPARPFKRRELESELGFEVIVSHVCTYWRDVALRTPALWTSIRLRKPVHLERSREFVARSRNQPLDILLDTVTAEEYEQAPEHLLGIKQFDLGFQVAIKHTHRWRSLIVKVCDLPCKERARANLRDCPPIPKLETLQLWHVQDWNDAANMLNATRKAPIPILNDDVPSLLNMSLVGVNLAYPQTHYLVGLRQLELALHAEFCRPSSAEFERILRDCPGLERLSLHYSGPRVDGTVDEDAPAIRMEKLTELALTNMDVDVVAHVVRRVAMPNLRALELELPSLQEGLDFTSVVDWLASLEIPAFPRLEHLYVSDFACNHAVWARWLATMPDLRHLQIDFEHVGDPFFAPLLRAPPLPSMQISGPPAGQAEPPIPSSSATSAVQAPAVLLPRLEHLKIAHLPSARLRALAEFRSGIGVPVPHFHVHIKSVDEDTDQLQDAGFPVKYYGIEEVLADDDEEEPEEDYSDEEDDGEEGDGEEDADQQHEAQQPASESSGDTRVDEDEPRDYELASSTEPADYNLGSATEYSDEDGSHDDGDDGTQADSGNAFVGAYGHGFVKIAMA